jgi:hypothetical protein
MPPDALKYEAEGKTYEGLMPKIFENESFLPYIFP